MAAMLVDTVDMQNANGHIDGERFAAFDHDALTTDELAHLAGCAACRAERQAFLSLQSLAAGEAFPTSANAPRLTSWESLATQLRAEGLLTSSAERATSDAPVVMRSLTRAGAPPEYAPLTRRVRREMPVWLRVAAAMLLTIGGAFAGRLSNGVVAFSASPTPDARAALDTQGFGSVQQATDGLYRAQRDYERASLWLAANDSTVHSSDVYRARLAALDQMMTASRAALREAPQDPVLNHYFLSAYTAREATLQALGGALPVDKRLERY